MGILGAVAAVRSGNLKITTRDARLKIRYQTGTLLTCSARVVTRHPMAARREAEKGNDFSKQRSVSAPRRLIFLLKLGRVE